MALTVLNPGTQGFPGSGSGIPLVDGLLLTTAGDVLRSAFAQETLMRGTFVEQQLQGYVATQEEYVGNPGVSEWPEGRFFASSSDAGNTGVSSPGSGGYQVRLDPLYNFIEIKASRQKLLKATHATQRTMKYVERMGREAAAHEEIRMLLTAIQTASMTDPNFSLQSDGTTALGSSLTKTEAATYSNFPVPATNGPAGIYFDANLGTTGKAVETMFRRAEQFAMNLGWPIGRVRCQIRPTLMDRWVGASGRQTSVTASDVADITKALDVDFGKATGSYSSGLIEEYLNIKVQRNRFLNRLGDWAKKILNANSASPPASGTNAGKYLPGQTSGFSQTVAGIAGHQILGNNTPIFDVGLGGSNGNVANYTDMVKWLNNICAVFYVDQDTCKKNILEEIPLVIEDVRGGLFRWFNMAWLSGMGPVNTQNVFYATTGNTVGTQDTNL